MIRPLDSALASHSGSLISLSKDGGFDWALEDFAHALPGKAERSFVLYEGDEPIGYVVASRKGPSTHIHQIVVAPESQAQGHGKTLLDAVSAAATDAQDISITLKVRADNSRALDFYRRNGFELIDANAADGGYQKWELLLRPARSCAVHQPNFLPHFGYFHKIARADVFVFMDEAQVPRGRSFASRNRVLSPNGPLWLTLPIRRGPEGLSTYREAQVADEDWGEKITKTLHANYARSEHWSDVINLLEPEFRGRSLAEIGRRLIETISRALLIETEFTSMSSLGDLSGQKSDLIISMCTRVGATHYLSGTGGGRAYNDHDAFSAANLVVRYDDFAMQPYPQLWTEDFVPNLSIVDILFNIGFDATADRLTHETTT